MTRTVIGKLSDAGYTLMAPTVYKKDLKGVPGISFESERNMMKKSELCIVLGGDGSILKSAGACAEYGVELLGINLGHVGYMSALESGNAENIVRFLNTDYRVESRMMLYVEIIRNSEVIFSGAPVLNDAVIAKSRGYGVIETSVYNKGNLLNKYRGDGLIIATPTGSTAYSVSAGGPIIDSGLDCICVTPICAHSLKSRPIIFGADYELEITCSSNLNSSCVTLDGNLPFEIVDGDVIRIKRSDKRLKLIRSSDQSFCNTFYQKLSDI